MSIGPVVLNENKTQFSLPEDTGSVYTCQTQMKWWQRLLNLTVANIFSALKTRAVRIEVEQHEQTVFMSNKEFSVLWHRSGCAAKEKIAKWKPLFEKVHSKELKEEEGLVPDVFRQLDVVVDVDTLARCLSGEKLSAIKVDEASAIVAAALQRLLATPDDQKVRETAKSVYKCVAQHFKANFRNVNEVLLDDLYRKLRRQVKVLTKPEKCSSEEKCYALMQVTWLHGTQGHVIKSACERTEGMLLPSGELQKRRITVLTGEMHNGATAIGINQENLSGVPLRSAREAIDYAKVYQLDVSSEQKQYNALLHRKRPTDKRAGLESCIDVGDFTRSVEAFKRMKLLHPDVVWKDLSKWKAKVRELYQDLDTFVFQVRPKEIFHWHDSYWTSKLYTFVSAVEKLSSEVESIGATADSIDAEDVELCHIPIVFGSNTVFGRPIAWGTEEVIRSAKLGKDIQYIFTPKEHIQRIKSLVQKHLLPLQVLDVALLQTAAKDEEDRRVYLRGQ